MKTVVIAEVGSCHDNSFERAMALIAKAADAGAAYAKFQYWSSASRLAARRRAPQLREAYEKYQLPTSWLAPLAARCHGSGMKFACSTFLPEDVDTVAQYADLMKIASLEANDPELLVAHQKHLRAGKPIAVSLGAGADTVPIKHYLVGLPREVPVTAQEGVLLFHCVSGYPTPLDQLQLGRLRVEWDWPRSRQHSGPYFNGLSDHSPSSVTLTGALGVALGVTHVERHVRLEDTSASNPDYSHAMTPSGFIRYCLDISYAESACGTATDVQPCEQGLLKHRVGVEVRA